MDELEQHPVQPVVATELRVERDDHRVSLARGDGVAVDRREDLDVRAVLDDTCGNLIQIASSR